MRSGSILSDGLIVEAERDEKALTITGWTAAFEPVVAGEFRLFVGDREVHDFDVQKHMPTPSLAASHALFTDHASCGYRIVAPLDADLARSVDESLIRVYPVYGDASGHVMVAARRESLPTPPEECIRFIGGNYWEGAIQFLSLFLTYGDLQPSDDVLDVGCGFGRMSLPLTRYLSREGSYEGFDVRGPVVPWAQENITPRFSNFRFREIDLFNESYNPGGTVKASELVFPYDDASFDFVFLTSVFTHMFPPDVLHYLREIRRCLRDGGRCLFTCFILDQESKRLIAEGESKHDISHRVGDCWVMDPERPLTAVGYEKEMILQALADVGFEIVVAQHGSWSGRAPYATWQDLVVVRK